MEAVEYFNSAGMPFMLAMNGGLGLPPETEIDLSDARFSTESSVLRVMQESAEKHKVRNLVTVLHSKLLEVINRQYPDLGVIKSCIAFTGGKKGRFKGRQEYTDAFERFEGVVPLNQHTTPGFLREWIAYASRMVLLLNSHCDCSNMHKCYTHYQMLDAPYLFHALEVDEEQKGEVAYEDFDAILNPEFPYTPGCDEHNKGQLLGRQDHLKEFMRWGVNKFKFGRNPLYDSLNPTLIREMVRTFLEAS